MAVGSGQKVGAMPDAANWKSTSTIIVATGEVWNARQPIRSAAEISSEAPHNLSLAPVRSEARAHSKMPNEIAV